MVFEMHAGGLVERAHRDAESIATDRFPEQERAARRTEASTDLLRRAVPRQLVLAGHRECRARHSRRDPEVARLLPALRAVAGVATFDRARDLELDGAARARALRHARTVLSARVEDRANRIDSIN